MKRDNWVVKALSKSKNRGIVKQHKEGPMAKDNGKKEKAVYPGFYKITFFIGLGFFTMGLMDPLYDTYVPIFLSRFIDSKAIIGFIMTLDNLFAILLIPIVAALSDRTETRIGRRMPYIITLLPLTALVFGLIPYAAFYSLSLLIVAVFMLNLFKQAVRGPVVALMPDITPGEFRSEANGVINTMGGIASIVGTIGLAQLMNVQVSMPGGTMQDEVLAYPVAGLLVVMAALLLFIFVKEPKEAAKVAERSSATFDATTIPTGSASATSSIANPADSGSAASEASPQVVQSPEKKPPILQSLKQVFRASDKSAFFVLVSIFFWFLAYQGILPYIGLYAKESLGFSSGLAALPAGAVGIAYALCAIPSGVVAHKIGRKKAIRIALAVLVVVLTALFIHGGFVGGGAGGATSSVTGANAGSASMVTVVLFMGLLFCFGIFWVTVVTNSFPMLWQMASYTDMGIYTGLYYLASQLSSIVAPPVTGGIIDLFGYRGIFLFAALCMLVAFFVMSFVKRGEPHDDANALSAGSASSTGADTSATTEV